MELLRFTFALHGFKSRWSSDSVPVVRYVGGGVKMLLILAFSAGLTEGRETAIHSKISFTEGDTHNAHPRTHPRLTRAPTAPMAPTAHTALMQQPHT
jgi:hypothetical protein